MKESSSMLQISLQHPKVVVGEDNDNEGFMDEKVKKEEEEEERKKELVLVKQRKKEEGKRRSMEIARQRRLMQQPEVESSTKKKKRHGARNQHRHKFFIRWLLETFPHITSSSSRYVLDIAGGKGELTARLTMCHSIPVILIDPRKAHVEQCYTEQVYKSLPKKWQQRISQRIQEEPNFVQTTLASRYHQYTQLFDTYSVQSSPHLQTAIQQSSLLIGLHADSATEDIVTMALQYNKPFVVVPCCVFPNLFHQRRLILGNGESSVPVRSHEQFCQYLLQKDSRLHQSILPFEGRNIAIWWEGPNTPTTDNNKDEP